MGSDMQIIYVGYNIAPIIDEANRAQLYTWVGHLSKDIKNKIYVIDLKKQNKSYIKIKNNVIYFSLGKLYLKTKILNIILRFITLNKDSLIHFISTRSMLFSEISTFNIPTFHSIINAENFLSLLDEKIEDFSNSRLNKRKFIVETRRSKNILSSVLKRDNIEVIPPFLELTRWNEKELGTDSHFTLLFASSPFDEITFDTRGLNILLNAMEIVQDESIKLMLPWREKKLIPRLERILSELSIEDKVNVLTEFVDMAELYSRSHATIAPFSTFKNNKEIPHSIIESLACNRPVIVTPYIGFYKEIENSHVGIVASPTPEDIVKKITHLKSNYLNFKVNNNCRKFAEKYFGETNLNLLLNCYGIEAV